MWWRGVTRRHPVRADAILAGVMVVPGVGTAWEPTWTTALVSAIAFVAVTLRSLWPVVVTVVTAVVSAVVVQVTAEQQPLLLLAVAVVAYRLATLAGRRTTWLVAGGSTLLMYLADALGAHARLLSSESFGVIAFLGMVTAIGDATRSRRAYIAAVEERARRAEQDRDEEAQRRVIQERLRIARELHDVVAHHIAVINVQTGVANHLLDRRPEGVRPALGHIHDACDTVLGELASIVGVLRQDDDPDFGTEPISGLDRLPALVTSLTAAGLEVRHRQDGDARDLPAVVDLAAYRIVQEALTNAHKYGTGSAELVIGYGPDTLSIDVVNAVADTRAPTRSGFGILGMTERVAATHGTLTTRATPDGRFCVHAELPVPTVSRPEDPA
ncbi:sensor histidine kinase [Actinoplanes sp. NPDC051494]|uniref:sensor histidine kinase n=1 Tax=Actinoplanes sp. NPDC051494 TaxID=3363907 RepID=UPI003789E207